MNKQMRIVRKEDQKVNTWSGGKTTEITIFPLNASYENRDFIFRLSSATVEIEESDFTKLEDTHRVLMLLDGELTLIHPDRYEKKLTYLDTDTFEGDWGTKSIGKAKDFNLMVKGKDNFNMIPFSIAPRENLEERLKSENSVNHYMFFMHKGKCEIKIDHASALLQEGDLLHLIFEKSVDSKITIENKEIMEAKVIFSYVKY